MIEKCNDNLQESKMARDKKIIYIIEDDVALNHGIELTLGNEAYECRQFFTLGEIQHIEQADLVILDEEFLVDTVFVRGQKMVEYGKALVKGTFETD